MDSQSNPPMNNAGAPTPTPMPQAPQSKEGMGSVGPVIGSLIIIVVLVLGGIYFLGSKMQSEIPAPVEQSQEAAVGEETAAIDAELDAMGTEDMDRESAAIEAALQ